MSQMKSIQVLLWAILIVNIGGYVSRYYSFTQQTETFTRLQYKNYQAIRNTEEDLKQARFEIRTLGSYLDAKFYDQRLITLAATNQSRNDLLRMTDRSSMLFNTVNTNMKERGDWSTIYKKNQYSHKWLDEKLKMAEDTLESIKDSMIKLPPDK